MGILKIILAVLFPPLAVLLDRGVGGTLLLNILLTIIGVIPGIIHAFWVLSNQPEPALA